MAKQQMSPASKPTVAIVRSKRAFLPEVDAYASYLRRRGFHCAVVGTSREALECGAVVIIVFYGLFPKWSKRPTVLVADVNSRSVGTFRHLRDVAKLLLNHKPDIRVTQNEYVAASLVGRGAAAGTHRGMGYFPALVRARKEMKYDVIYSGTSSRSGVTQAIWRLLEEGLRVCVVGSRPNFRDVSKELTVVERASVREVYELYSQTRVGLNYVPIREPFIRQESTKLIEYCAAGLGVVTTRYPWVNQFEESRNGRFLTWSEDLTRKDILCYPYEVPCVDDLAWPDLLDRTCLAEIIEDLLKGRSGRVTR